MTDESRPTLLCVDDEQAILDGLRRQLRNAFRVTVAISGADGLAAIAAATEPFAIVMSDMMMPAMNGAEFLRRAKEAAPRSVRVLLTGQADLESAAAAVNSGAISRFLTKPCNGDDLIDTLRACANLYVATMIEQDVLERTVHGAIDALAQTLSLAAPAVFARITRVQRTVNHLIEQTEPSEAWAIQVAVPLSQLGAVTLPDDCQHRAESEMFATPKERLMAAKVPRLSVEIINKIPRLEPVCQIIADAFDNDNDLDASPPGSAIVRIAFALDVLEARGTTRVDATDQLKQQMPISMHALLDQVGDADDRPILTIPLSNLIEGMEIAEDLTNDKGVLLVGRGTTASSALIARLRNCLDAGQMSDQVLVREWKAQAIAA